MKERFIILIDNTVSDKLNLIKSLIFLVLGCCSRFCDLLENSITYTPRLSSTVIHSNHPLSHHECEYQSYGTDDSLGPE